MGEYKRVFKMFLVTEDQKEENWLREMALKGYHLDSVTAGVSYNFRIGEPRDYTYLVDFKGIGSKADLEYRSFFEDAGFKYITTTMGYHYYRTETSSNSMKRVKADQSRKGEKYKQLSGTMLTIGIMNLFIYIINIGVQKIPLMILLSQLNLICAILMAMIYILLKVKQKTILQDGEEATTFTKMQSIVKYMISIVFIGLIIAIGAIILGSF